MPGPASPLASAVSTMEDVSSTDVGYCSSSILGLAKMRCGSDERHDSRCFCFISLELEPVSPKLDGV